MKHVQESLSQYYDYKFFKVFEEDEKAELQDKEKDGLAVIDKITKNFEDFKKNAKGEILKYKEFWEENKKTKEGFDAEGAIYKMFDSNYVVGVMELPVETLSDGSIDGGMGATDEPEEEIIEGKEIGIHKPDDLEQGKAGSPALEEAAGEEEDLDLDLEEKPEGEGEGVDMDLNLEDKPDAEDDGVDMDLDLDPDSGGDTSADTGTEGGVDVSQDDAGGSGGEDIDLGNGGGAEVEEPVDAGTPDMNAPQKYFVVYDISGEEREEILRCGSNNVVNAFNSFYNDTFKGTMKNAIIQYKESKELEKKEAEKAEKAKVETTKQSKIKKFLGES